MIPIQENHVVRGEADTRRPVPRWPAWIGSVLFHLVVLALVLLLLYLRPPLPEAPGDDAVGGIVLKESTDSGESYIDSQNNRVGEASPQQADEQPTAPTPEELLNEEFSDINMRQALPVSPNAAIGPASAHSSQAHVAASAAVLSEKFHGGSPFPGVGSDRGGKKLSMFGTNGQGNTFVFVIDRSGSMDERGGRPMRAARAEIVRNINLLDDLNQFNIIFYNDQYTKWRAKGMPFATDAERESAKRFAESQMAAGGTKHQEPLREALQLGPEIIFFLTDGDESELQLNEAQLARINRLNSHATQINVIQFGLGPRRESAFLRRLAADNRGMYQYLNVAELE